MIPEGYKYLTPETMYVPLGGKITVACEDDDLIIGDSTSASFTCNFNSDGVTVGFQGLDAGLQTCRPKYTCDPAYLPMPSTESGLRRPFQTQVLEEGEFVEYTCEEGDPWKLFGAYTEEEFAGTGVQIMDGKLRVSCMVGGIFASPTAWPKCRDSEITQCKPQDFPDLSVHELVGTTNDPVDVGGIYEIRCYNPNLVTETFFSMELICGYDGKIILPETNFTNCRLARPCPVFDEAPAETNLVKTGPSPATEFQYQTYTCNAGYTLAGNPSGLIDDAGLVQVSCAMDDTGAIVLSEPFPNCQPIATSCDSIPNLVGLRTDSSGSIPVGNEVDFNCYNPQEVTDFGATISLECTEEWQLPTSSQSIGMPYCP